MKKDTKFNYDFKSVKVKKAFKMLAVQTDTTLQQVIEDALKAKYKNLFEK